jgi:glutathione peroxidase
VGFDGEKSMQSAKDIDGKEVNFKEFAGKAVLVVNVASACGFTRQNYVGLQALYQKYRDHGLEIVAFPSNQFGGQEPGDEAQIKQFAQSKYGVTFRMMSKVDVNGPKTHPVYQYVLAHASIVTFAVHLLVVSRDDLLLDS